MQTRLLKVLPVLLALTVTACGAKEKSSSSAIQPSDTSSTTSVPSSTSSSSSSNHEHTFAESWSFDTDYHWHEATCGHHEAENKQQHSFNEWRVDVGNGYKTRQCSICNYLQKEIISVYTVTWKHGDLVLSTELYAEGDTPSYKGVAPTKDKDADYNTYEFSGWDKPLSPIKEDTTFIAQFRRIDHVHTAGRTERVNEVAPKCVDNGSYQIVTYCAECGKAFNTETFEIPAVGHDLEQVAAKDATCTEVGWNAYEYCKKCNYTTKVEIPATGHIHTNTRIENEVPATCTEAGSYELITYCEDDNVELNRETIAIEPKGHLLQHVEAKAATCTDVGWNAYDYCTRENCNYTTKEEIAALGHENVLNSETLEYTCSRCGNKTGRDYEMTIEFDPVRVGDVYDKHAARVSWKNDDHALSFVYYALQVGSTSFSPWRTNTVVTDAMLGQNAIAHVYVGVNPDEEVDTSFVRIENGHLMNCVAICNGNTYSAGGAAHGSVLNPDGVSYYDYYHIEIPIGTVLQDAHEYTVTWKNYDGTVLETDTVHRGDMPSYDGATPTKPAADGKEYTFLGWDKELVPNPGEDVIYTARFGESAITYNVTFVVLGVSHVITYSYMDTPSYSPTLSYDEDGKTYVFQGWDKEIVPVTEAVTYTAVYAESLYKYALNSTEDGYIITNFTNRLYAGDLEIPSSLNGLPITGLANNLFYNTPNLQTVTIPNSVTSLGESLFDNSGVRKVIFGSGAEDIPYRCCYYCQNLTEVVIPEGVKTIGQRAFYRSALAGLLYFPDSLVSINRDAFNYSNVEVLRFGRDFTSLDYTAFTGCAKLYEAVNESTKAGDNYIMNYVGSGILAVVHSMDERGTVGIDEDGVKYYALPDNSLVVAIGYEGTSPDLVLNDRYTKIKKEAFINDTVLKNVDLGKVSDIGQYAFSYSAIETVKLSPNLTDIGEIFRGCRHLTSVDLNGAILKYVRGLTFADCTSLTTLDLGDSVLEYGQFLASSGVTSFTLSSVCRKVDLASAKLETIAVAEGNTNFKVNNNALYSYDGTKLIYVAYSGNSDFSIADGTTTIGQYAFYRSTNKFTSVTIPVSVTKIEKYAFTDVTGLTSITYLGTVEQFNAITKDSNAFIDCPVSQVTCSDGSVTVVTSD